MAVKPTSMPLSHVNTLAAEVFGPGTTVQDTPGVGAVGLLDATDSLVVAAPGTTKVLGVSQAENLAFRQRIVQAAKDLAASGASFSGSQQTDRVNRELWTMGYGGKMQVRKFLPNGEIGKPSAALRDIFAQGQLYGFECATAMMVIYHKAILDHIGDDAFDRHFSEPRLLSFFRWSIEDDDFSPLKRVQEDPKLSAKPPVPGSHYYFKNPDASPANSAFGGENTIYLGNDQWYAHGVVGSSGTYIVTTDEIIATLSSLRSPGATTKPFRIGMEMNVDGLGVSKLACPEPIGG